jgi:hypothetical protein
MVQEQRYPMNITPSAKSSFVAGIGFWVLLWLAILKLDEIAACLRLRRWLNTERCLNWVNQHKALALLGSECCNYSVHGISNPLGVTFALGGTLTNLIVICFLVLARTRIRSLLSRRSLTR